METEAYTVQRFGAVSENITSAEDAQKEGNAMIYKDLAKLITIYLYDHLPLGGVDTSYLGHIDGWGRIITMYPPLPSKPYEVVVRQKINIPNDGCTEERPVSYFGERLMARLTSLHPFKWKAFAGQVFVAQYTITLLYAIVIDERKVGTMDIVQAWKAKEDKVRPWRDGKLYRKSNFYSFILFASCLSEIERLSETWEIVREPIEHAKVVQAMHGGHLQIYNRNGNVHDTFNIPDNAEVTVKWED